ncbi:MAG: hydantoinase B/oxoprolinase family protein [Alphaproteobacteria bacterium]|nr:hydantoinase B/oxoprolinase family protein [Alphaproteobacteria bacterium]
MEDAPTPSTRPRAAATPAAAAMDPVLLEIMRHKVEAIADELCLTLLRTSRSVFVNEAADFAVGMVDLEGQMFAWAPENKTTSINVPAAHTIRMLGALEPGDVIVTNDPYLSDSMATHLPDLHMIRPYFHGDRVVAYGWGFIHYMDVGGRVPGSISPYNKDIFEEGLRIPPMKLLRRGVMNADLEAIFKANSRLPDVNMADIKAMLGALEVGGRRVADTIEHYGVETFIASQKALKDYAYAKSREVLRLLPDGVYEHWEYLDDDLVTPIPIRLRLKMTVRDGLVHFDVTGTDPQVEAAYNIPTSGKLHNMLTRRIITFIHTHDPDIPLNAGTFRPLSITSPPGTVLNAEFPDACGVRFSTAIGFNDAVTGVLLKAAPEKMAGPTCGTGFVLIVDEPPEAIGEPPKVVFAQVARGGMSAYFGSDGVDARDVTMNTMYNHPLETVEAKCPIAFKRYDIRPDSGGPGRWRGGVGQIVTIEALRDNLSVRVGGADRLRFPPWGVFGGKPGLAAEIVIDIGTKREKRVGNIEQIVVDRGQTVTLLTPGAAGYGNPFERDPEAVRADVVQGFATREGARRDYGVAIDAALAIDTAATSRLRRAAARRKPGKGFEFGPERDAWERVFDDATMCELNRRLFALPKPARQTVRRRIFEATVGVLPRAGERSLVSALRNSGTLRAKLKRAIARELPSKSRKSPPAAER